MKLKIIFLLIIFLGLAGYYVIRSGYYPLAIVNRTPIFASKFIENYGSALVYYQNILQTYPKDTAFDTSEILDELKRATLDKLIEDVLIYQELGRVVGTTEVSRLVSEKIPNFQESAVSLYGLTPERFK
ncbi:MAG: SurA N-terminal domain-containing protein [Patescibacteria group bacterium]